jgi:uncharacterized membrane protein
MPNPDPLCPACGTAHPPEAIFCGACGKAVGELRYVREEFEASCRGHEKVAESVTHFVGSPSYLGTHLLWLGGWILLNSGLVMTLHRWDDPPFNLLALVLSIEAVFLTGFLLISQNREAAYESKRAELDYETNVRAYRLLLAMDDRLAHIESRLNTLEEKR